MIIENPFASFWMAGFESTDQLNVHGDRVDFLNVTSHLELVENDYEGIARLNIRVAREGVRWSQAEPTPYQYDFTAVGTLIEAGRKYGIQQIWDLCHFGFPDDLTPLHPHFTRRFEAFCRAFAIFYKNINPGSVLIVTPINEVGFMSWLGGDVAATSPYCRNNGWHVKYAYMRAYIAGIRALKNIDPAVRIMTTEPLVNVVADISALGHEEEEAAFHHELQFQVLDMLSGRICPELGGKEEYLDLLGFNYYYDNQWILHPHQILGWNDPVPHPKLRPLSDLLHDAFKRYQRPILLSETSHPGEDRPLWIEYIGREIDRLLQSQVPFWGICLYPIIDRPDWDNLSYWHHAGIWDRIGDSSAEARVPHHPSFLALKKTQQKINSSEAQNTVGKSYDCLKAVRNYTISI